MTKINLKVYTDKLIKLYAVGLFIQLLLCLYFELYINNSLRRYVIIDYVYLRWLPVYITFTFLSSFPANCSCLSNTCDLSSRACLADAIYLCLIPEKVNRRRSIKRCVSYVVYVDHVFTRFIVKDSTPFQSLYNGFISKSVHFVCRVHFLYLILWIFISYCLAWFLRLFAY